MSLEAQRLSFHYPRGGHVPVLRSVSLSIAPGERVGLTASSGRGKTTLCKLMSDYERAAGGQVLLDGRPLGTYRGFCPVQLIWQDPAAAVDPLLPLGDTLREAGPADPELLRALHIEQDWLKRYPAELSGGELQRFCIARALATRPRYLICDEVSTMLDAVTQAHIWRVLLDYAARENAGMLLVSHTPALTARIATREVVLA